MNSNRIQRQLISKKVIFYIGDELSDETIVNFNKKTKCIKPNKNIDYSVSNISIYKEYITHSEMHNNNNRNNNSNNNNSNSNSNSNSNKNNNKIMKLLFNIVRKVF
jgi:hypothetical protein